MHEDSGIYKLIVITLSIVMAIGFLMGYGMGWLVFRNPTEPSCVVCCNQPPAP